MDNDAEISFVENKTLFVSIGICAFNEEKNIQYLLKSIVEQKSKRISIGEIIVVSDGSTDRTEEIVENFVLCKEIKLVRLKERCGKYVAINEFLKCAKYPIAVLASADIFLDEYAIENLCIPFLDEANVGITAARPVQKNSIDSFIGYMVSLQWDLRHKMSLVQPKFSELIAFRNISNNLIPTFTDEEYIAFLIKSKGYALRYIPSSVFYNKGPEKIGELILQRRRNHIGHIILKNEYNYEVATLSGINILKCLWLELLTKSRKKSFRLINAILIEMIIRGWVRLEVFFRRKPYNYKWKIAATTKVLNN